MPRDPSSNSDAVAVDPRSAILEYAQADRVTSSMIRRRTKALRRMEGRDPWWSTTRGKQITEYNADEYGQRRSVQGILDLIGQ